MLLKDIHAWKHCLDGYTGPAGPETRSSSPTLPWPATPRRHSQQLEDLHVAAERAVGLGSQLDAQGAAGGADHEAVYEVGLAVARAGHERRLGSAAVLHLHVDLAGGHDHRREPCLGQRGFLRHQVRAGVQKAQGQGGLPVAGLLAAVPDLLQARGVVAAGGWGWKRGEEKGAT